MTLIEILQKEGRQIEEEFLLASKQGEGTSQEIADFRENAVQDFLQRYYPTNHIVSKGKITDLNGNQSNSIDCLLLNPEHPNLIDSRGKFRLIFSDGCDCAIEVKPDLARTDEIHRALKQGISVKSLNRSRSSILLGKKFPDHILKYSKKIPFYIFCIKSFEATKLIETIKRYYIEQNISHEDQIDGVVILGKGIIKNLIYKELNFYNSAPTPIKENTGWYIEEWGKGTLIGMLLSLQYTYSSFSTMSDPIMKRVLTKIGRFNVRRICDTTQPAGEPDSKGLLLFKD